ncbi:hypothetical protein [Streptomyces liangshanensis]|uniref:hypothetical protein n=1 Tax=Streptomyces liangshanensis TaxID=2717324 RepID=UPI0036D7D8D1
MSTARQLALVELLCARAYPAARGPSGVGTSGPGYHLAELSRGEGSSGADQCEAEGGALAEILTHRFGEPHHLSLWSPRVRGGEGEEIPEPWWELCTGVAYVRVWWTGFRWLALGVTQEAELQPFRLLAAATDTDPP